MAAGRNRTFDGCEWADRHTGKPEGFLYGYEACVIWAECDKYFFKTEYKQQIFFGEKNQPDSEYQILYCDQNI